LLPGSRFFLSFLHKWSAPILEHNSRRVLRRY
jgi:hypothetical protein